MSMSKYFKLEIRKLTALGHESISNIQVVLPEITERPKEFWSIYQSGDRSFGNIQKVLELPNQQMINVTVQRETFLARLSNFDPGWKAMVDGVEIPIAKIRAFQGIPLSEGPHVVFFKYSPDWQWSIYISLTTFFLYLSWFCLGYRLDFSHKKEPVYLTIPSPAIARTSYSSYGN